VSPGQGSTAGGYNLTVRGRGFGVGVQYALYLLDTAGAVFQTYAPSSVQTFTTTLIQAQVLQGQNDNPLQVQLVTCSLSLASDPARSDRQLAPLGGVEWAVSDWTVPWQAIVHSLEPELHIRLLPAHALLCGRSREAPPL
jgi:hypothetical protein